MTAPVTEPVVRIIAPIPGRAVLACRCGRVLALTDMHRPVRDRPRSPGSPAVLEPICCRLCAAVSPL